MPTRTMAGIPGTSTRNCYSSLQREAKARLTYFFIAHGITINQKVYKWVR